MFWQRRQQYQSLPEERESKVEGRPSSTRERHFFTVFSRHGAILFILAVVIIVFIPTWFFIWHSQPPDEILDCGSSPEEARSLGCHYEMNSLRWVPEACHDRGLELYFEQNFSFRYYNDSSGDFEIPKEVIARGETDNIHISWEYHLTHCLFIFEKVYKAALDGRENNRLHSNIWDREHFHHCTKAMMQRNQPLSSLHTTVTLAYMTCPH